MKAKFVALFLLTALLTPGLLHAAEASPELIAQGKELFTKKDGLKVKFACILCHGKGKEIKKSKISGLGPKLPDVINKYIASKSKGKPIAKDSQEMKALQAYILNEHSK